MKFTELHIAVVTFHSPSPTPWNLFSPFSSCRMRFSWVTRKDRKREERAGGKKERNKTRENMINREIKGRGRIWERGKEQRCVSDQREKEWRRKRGGKKGRKKKRNMKEKARKIEKCEGSERGEGRGEKMWEREPESVP